MTTQRMIEFTTATDEGRRRVTEAVGKAFEALDTAQPDGVRLAYWRSQDGRRFVAMIDLVDEGSNPLLDIGPARELPKVIGEQVEDGYPDPEVMDLLGSYGFGGALSDEPGAREGRG